MAIFFGALIGWERQTKYKSAGLRTHILVSLGSAVFILIPILLDINGKDVNSIARAIQGIATGIGFLGAEEIWRDVQTTEKRTSIYGLTSAAAIWIAAGCGLWQRRFNCNDFSFSRVATGKKNRALFIN